MLFIFQRQFGRIHDQSESVQPQKQRTFGQGSSEQKREQTRRSHLAQNVEMLQKTQQRHHLERRVFW